MNNIKKTYLRNEVERKLVHVLHAITITYLIMQHSYTTIVILEIGFLVSVSFVRKSRWFHGMYEVDRISYGEFFMPIAFIILSALNTVQWIFLVAVLHLALADVAAAFFGIIWGKKQYGILGLKKTVVGTCAFMAVSIFIGVGAYLITPLNIGNGWPVTIICTTIASTIMENISPVGSDNLTIPLSVVYTLSTLTT